MSIKDKIKNICEKMNTHKADCASKATTRKASVNKFRINNSLRLRMTLIMTITVVSIILLCWGINRVFLTEFYTSSKIDKLQAEYNSLNKDFSKDRISEIENSISSRDYSGVEDFGNKLQGRSESNGTKVYIFNLLTNYYSEYSESNVMYFQIYYPFGMSDRMRESIHDKLDSYVKVSSYGGDEETLAVKGYQIKKLEGCTDYNVYKMYDEKLNSNSIELFGQLDSGLYVMISSNFENMQESVSIANNFLAYIGIFVTIFASIMVFFISRSISKPILELSVIAEKMAQLDFDAKIKITSDDEIAVLGKSMNFMSEKLKQTVSELKLANAELLKDIENKTKIDEMRKDFLSNISHELKTPIALVQGYAEGLKENINDDEESRNFYCDVIVDEAHKMNNMVMKILDLNHIEFGDSAMSMERFDIGELMEAILASTDILFLQKEVRLIYENTKQIYVWADSFMIEEVITNYISNALNHIDGDKIIEIKFIQREEVVRVAVFNTGNNIPEEDIDRIWDKFYKVDKARTREYGGSGVGLSIVKAILDAHGRECGVVNRSNGVEFWFELDTKVLSEDKDDKQVE